MTNEERWWKQLGLDIAAALTFYTCIPIPAPELDFRGVARLAPVVGLIIGSLLGLVDAGLRLTLNMPVQDPQRRLAVMADSATGAFGAMAAIALVLIKTAALSDLDSWRWLALMATSGWGRWGQQVAIAQYPYLKPVGKGAFHKAAIRNHLDVLPGLLLLLGLSGLQILLDHERVAFAVGMALGGGAISVLTSAWFNHKLGGHTGDTYGAVVEWTEALLLCLLTALQGF